ncbi:uncharacterized protein ColSpa_03004 [Colletotrichum spaethianum]|uniref:Uncharacterized protein n=1 Tax=Colletotrichum spaethianum TaxID=700344 RepID=A0AA37L6L0_9PEZI|nr:uncharacterized protein ColSpa_03004 [Colletotrichum spaethianum]GKT42823.1 hypothetical protein ColSpa_03004 [Colletotrichum spaethianum]
MSPVYGDRAGTADDAPTSTTEDTVHGNHPDLVELPVTPVRDPADGRGSPMEQPSRPRNPVDTPSKV